MIMGSGRVGSRVAASLATDGHSVAVIDPDRQQVMRLPRALVESGAIELVPGDGSSGSSMRAAGIETADLFLALSGDDAVNGLAAQKARTMFGVRRVGCRVQDDGLHELYTGLGIMVTSPTHLVTDVILQSMSDM
ncbi:MAG: potassium channel family protein [Chloroflexota bacterium]